MFVDNLGRIREGMYVLLSPTEYEKTERNRIMADRTDNGNKVIRNVDSNAPWQNGYYYWDTDISCCLGPYMSEEECKKEMTANGPSR